MDASRDSDLLKLGRTYATRGGRSNSAITQALAKDNIVFGRLRSSHVVHQRQTLYGTSVYVRVGCGDLCFKPYFGPC